MHLPLQRSIDCLQYKQTAREWCACYVKDTATAQVSVATINYGAPTKGEPTLTIRALFMLHVNKSWDSNFI